MGTIKHCAIAGCCNGWGGRLASRAGGLLIGGAIAFNEDIFVPLVISGGILTAIECVVATIGEVVTPEWLNVTTLDYARFIAKRYNEANN